MPEDELRRGYETLLIFDMSVLIIEDAANELEDREIYRYSGFERLMMAVTVLQALESSLNSESPNEGFEEAWEQAKDILSVVADVERRWLFDEEIESSQAAEELIAPREEIDKMMTILDERLMNEYGVTNLTELREEITLELERGLEEIESEGN